MPRFLAAGLVAMVLSLPAAASADQDPVYTATLSDLAVSGYDPVAYFTDGEPVEGSDDLVFDWNGATWRFASQAHLDQFKADPARVRAPVRRLLRLGGQSGLHRLDRPAGLEDRRWQAVPELQPGREEDLGAGRARQHRQGRRQLAGRAAEVARHRARSAPMVRFPDRSGDAHGNRKGRASTGSHPGRGRGRLLAAHGVG